eukprot:c27385_g1_i1.p1 GENE.c27385_g1_i1~~c27385_g1_i1.p1  ORF type:complete len:391 (+),score=90.42 c27385_g1_i1:148-1173(+)
MVELDGYRLLKIRNPHGTNEWKGDWSDHDAVHWTAARKAALGWSDEDDGEFWISVQDFVANYRIVYVCKVFPRTDWLLRNCISGFTGVERGPQDCPQFLLSVRSRVTVVISMRQAETRRHGKDPAYVSFELVDNKGAPIDVMRADMDFVFEPRPFINYLEVSWEGVLEASDTPYTLIARTYQYKGQGRFNLRVFTKTAREAEAVTIEEITGQAVAAHVQRQAKSAFAGSGGAAAGAARRSPLEVAAASVIEAARVVSNYTGAAAQCIPLVLRIGQELKDFNAVLPAKELTRGDYAEGPPTIKGFQQVVLFAKAATAHPDPDLRAVTQALIDLVQTIVRRCA